LEPGQLGGISVYQATLPPGTVQAGKFTVTANGGADVGAFQATINVGADIQIQTPLAGATLFSAAACALTINWTGGDPNSWVTMNIVQPDPSAFGGIVEPYAMLTVQTRASTGTLTTEPGPFGTCGGSAPEPIQIAIEVDPDPSEIGAFSASGLSLGGQVTWRYIHTFQVSIELYY
jgi:hypothetical protein